MRGCGFWKSTVLRAPALGLVFFLGARSAPAQSVITSGERPGLPFSTASSDWEGYSEFVQLAQRRLGTARIAPSAQLDFGNLRSNDAIIIVRPLRPLDERSLSAFLADGGRVALLDDFGKGDTLLRKFGIVRISPPANPVERLRSNPDLAIAVPSVQLVAGAERGRHPIAEHVDAVVTNHPLVLRHPDLTPVLEIRDATGRSEALAVTGVIAKKGRLFALGDPSVFINLMLRYPGNRNFAEGLIDYLAPQSPFEETDRKSPLGAQQGKIWIVANDFEQLGRYGDDESLLEKLKRHLEEAAQTMISMDEEGMPGAVATFLAALLALMVVSRELSGNVNLSPLPENSFSRPALLAAQTGLGARANILGSKNAHPILALMELDAALRESAARRLGVSPSGSERDLTDSFQSSGLAADDAASLAKLLTDLRTYGQSLGQGKPKKTTESSMRNYHRESMRLLGEMERVGKST